MIQNLTIGDISIDCKNPEQTRGFYAELFGWEKRTMYGCPAVIADNGLVILFMSCDFDYIPPVWPEEPGKQQKQMHLDFLTDDVSATVGKALRLGAVKADERYNSDHLVVMLDPEGHPFCLCQRGRDKSEFDLYYERKGYGEIPGISINIDCPNQQKLRRFYAELTDWDGDFHWAVLIPENRMIVCFQGCDADATMDNYIQPVWPEEPGKQQKQMHFNFQVDDLFFAVEEAIRLGATKPTDQYGGDHFVTLLDPEGHPFCLCRRAN
jgi:catechol 2,3-dioxygenase-like lactoylglutathione lyase family enzyme